MEDWKVRTLIGLCLVVIAFPFVKKFFAVKDPKKRPHFVHVSKPKATTEISAPNTEEEFSADSLNSEDFKAALEKIQKEAARLHSDIEKIHAENITPERFAKLLTEALALDPNEFKKWAEDNDAYFTQYAALVAPLLDKFVSRGFSSANDVVNLTTALVHLGPSSSAESISLYKQISRVADERFGSLLILKKTAFTNLYLSRFNSPEDKVSEAIQYLEGLNNRDDALILAPSFIQENAELTTKFLDLANAKLSLSPEDINPEAGNNTVEAEQKDRLTSSDLNNKTEKIQQEYQSDER